MTDSDDSHDSFSGQSRDQSRPIPQAPDFAKSGSDSLLQASPKSAFASSAILKTLRKRHVGIPLVGLVLLGAVAFMAMSHDPARLPHASSEPDPMAQDRAAVADFTVKSIDGDTFKLSDYRGKVVLVSFWASDCTTCVLEFPAFAELKKRYKKEGLHIVSINLDATDAGAKSAKELWDHGSFDFKAYLDPTQTVAKAFNIETVPSGFVIDRQGRMAFNSYGANDWLAPETARMIEDLLLEN